MTQINNDENNLSNLISAISLQGVDISRVHHIEQYFGTVWAMREDNFVSAVQNIAAMDLGTHITANAGTIVINGSIEDDGDEVQAAAGSNEDKVYKRVSGGAYGYYLVRGSIALIDITGPMLKYASSFSSGVATVQLRKTIRAAANNDVVQSIILKIDSPGGAVAGNKDLADDVAMAASKKTVVAYIEDLGASAAYWIASQTNKIYANTMALVGSIGTYGVLYDYSKWAKKEGVKALVFKTGEFKGSGTLGTEITDIQQNEFQRIIDELNEHFIQAVSTGRKMSIGQVKKTADGRVHLAADAVKLGLIDGVKTLDQVINDLANGKLSGNNSTGIKAENVNPINSENNNNIMTETENTKMTKDADKEKTTIESSVLITSTASATLAELKAAIPNGNADFYMQCLDKSMTMEQAKDHWADHQQARIESRDTEIEKLKAKQNRPGVEALGSGNSIEGGGSAADSYEGDPIAEFNAKVAEHTSKGMLRSKAAIKVGKANPELLTAYISATNKPTSKVQAMIQERHELSRI